MTIPSRHPHEAARRIRRMAEHIAKPIGKRIGTGTVWQLDQLSMLVEEASNAQLAEHPDIRRLLRIAHDLPMNSEANWSALLGVAIMQGVDRYARMREWQGFEVSNPATWPRRNHARQ